jgi:hypothetical protein
LSDGPAINKDYWGRISDEFLDVNLVPNFFHTNLPISGGIFRVDENGGEIGKAYCERRLTKFKHKTLDKVPNSQMIPVMVRQFPVLYLLDV